MKNAFSRRGGIAAVATLALLALGACLSSPTEAAGSDPATDTFAASLGINISTFTKTSSGLYYKDITVGTGAAATATSTVTVNYTLWTADGVVRDGPRTGSSFNLAGNIIAGFREGLSTMKVGGHRLLVIPSKLGYGTDGNGDIKPNTSLVFDVTLTAVN
ncbi:MAG: fbp [Gemmatimonadetes bacterium]|nr:fbp [Gemmatimonadota bacterium]